jgi:peptidoglycan/LPS O-acetylase OafA/YrhL
VTATLAPGRPATAASHRRIGHRRDVEGLRAIAVLLVVLYHCGVPFLPGGYVGVDVFFVISGYLITGLLSAEYAATGRIVIVRFYARRMRRLLPAALLVTAVTVLAGYRFLSPLRAPQVALDALTTTLYGVNYRLAAAGVEYLNVDAAPSPLQHFWSLAVEEQFYLVWPVVVLVAYGGRRWIVPAVLVGSLALAMWQTTANPTWAYFGLHTRAWELAAGALVAMIGGRLPREYALLGLGAIGLAATAFTDRTAFPGYAAVLPVAGTVLVLLARSRVLDAAPLQAIGRLSYSWYLWHWPFLVFGGGPKLLLAAAALVTAAVTYGLVENPIRRRRFPPRATVAAGLVVTLLAALGYAGITRLPAAEPPGVPAPPLVSLGPANLGATPAAVPANLTPPLRRAALDQPRLYRDGCNSAFTDPTIRKPCAYGDRGSATTVVLFGDSHAGAWFPALAAIAEQRRWRLVVVTKSACSVASVRVFHEKLNRPFTECVRWRESAWNYIASLRPSMVVMASAAAGGGLSDLASDVDAAWTAGWARSAYLLSHSHARLYYLEDTPYQPRPVPDCLAEHPAATASCATDRASALPNPRRRAMVSAEMRRRGVTVIDPTSWFCTTSSCPVIVGNVLVYRDISHVTATYARLLAPLLSPYLRG